MVLIVPANVFVRSSIFATSVKGALNRYTSSCKCETAGLSYTAGMDRYSFSTVILPTIRKKFISDNVEHITIN
jgi:hypothetical protein